jgi:lipopolysaccharide export system ATP-binding protein
MALLEASGLVKQFGKRRVVDGVDMVVREGEIVGLLGPNGAGKTTSFRMIVGMSPPTAGRVVFAGKDVTFRPMFERARLGLGYLAQEHSIFRKLTVEENIAAVLELITTRRGKPFRPSGRARRKRVEELLEQFGLTKIRKNLSMLCSGGEKRRLEIARCLASEPMLIMLDEPFTGIDPVTVDDIQRVIRQLANDGISILITDHKAIELLRITDRSYLVAAGKVLVSGTTPEIVHHPDAKRLYFGEGIQAAIPGTQPQQMLGSAHDAFGGQPRIPTAGSLRSLLDMDDLYQSVNQLGGPDAAGAAARIRKANRETAARLLLQALSWNDAAIRAQSHRLLCEFAGADLPFDPYGSEITRSQQIECLRQHLAQRRAA